MLKRLLIVRFMMALKLKENFINLYKDESLQIILNYLANYQRINEKIELKTAMVNVHI